MGCAVRLLGRFRRWLHALFAPMHRHEAQDRLMRELDMLACEIKRPDSGEFL